MTPEKEESNNDKLLAVFKQQQRPAEKRRFGPKLEVVDDLCFALMHCDHFEEDLNKIRAKHHIPPKLDPKSDIKLFAKRVVAQTKVSLPPSLFWWEQGPKLEAAFDRDIRKLIDSYEHVPSSLFLWVKHVAMYRVELKWPPDLGTNLLDQVLKNPKDIFKLPLTEEEKGTLLSMARGVLGKKPGRSGRPTKISEKIYADVSKVINSSPKGKFRVAPISADARKIFLLREEGKSYREIVRKLYPAVEYVDEKMDRIRRKDFDLRDRIAELTKKVRK